MSQRIHHRPHSRLKVLGIVGKRGAAFLGVRREDEAFIPTGEMENIYGSADAWMAHQLLRVCAGCPREVRG
jgi:hypothetical protein